MGGLKSQIFTNILLYIIYIYIYIYKQPQEKTFCGVIKIVYIKFERDYACILLI